MKKNRIIGLMFFVIAMVLFEKPAIAQQKYFGVFSSGSGSNIITKPKNWNGFVSDGEHWVIEKGLRLVDVETVKDGSTRKYFGVYSSGSGNNIVTEPKSWKGFVKDGNYWVKKKGLRLIDVETFKDGSTRKYFGVYSSGSGNNIVTKPKSWKGFVKDGNYWVKKKGLRLIDVETFKDGSTRKYFGVYSSGSGSNIITKPKSWKGFVKDGEYWVKKKGLRLIDIETFKDGSTRKYFGVFGNGSSGNIITYPQKLENFLKEGKQLIDLGMRLVDVEVYGNEPVDIPSSPGHGSDAPMTSLDFSWPPYMELARGDVLTVDFTESIEGFPKITIPVGALDQIMPTYNGEIVFPSNMRGIKIIKAESIFWYDETNHIINTLPFNTVHNLRLEDETSYLEGIEFSGPIGAGEGENEPFVFPGPFLAGTNQIPADRPVKLEVQLTSGKIEFINYDIHPGESLDPHEFFKEEDLNELSTLEKIFEEEQKLREYFEILCAEYHLHCD